MNHKTQNYEIKHPVIADAEEVTKLVSLCDIEAIGEPDITLTDVLDLWNCIPLETNTWIAVSETNEIIGYAFLEETGEERMDTCVFVHPEYKSQGIGTLLLKKVEDRAYDIAGSKGGEQKLMNQIPFTNKLAIGLLESKGYQFSRLYERMKRVLTERPEENSISEDYQIQIFRPDQDEKNLYTLYSESFKDSWGYSKKDYETWIQQKKGDQYDPSLWYIVWENGEPIGFLMSRMQEDGLFIDLLGVKRESRKKGIGEALLLHVFKVAFDQGQSTVLLYVDTDSLTNAHRVYRKVGMNPDSQTAVYMKVLK